MREFMLIRVILLNADIQKELKLSTEEIEYLSSKA
jgi:hypothetical protein